MDFKETKAYSQIKEFILMVNNCIKNEKQIQVDSGNILSKIREIVLSTPLSEHKGRFANPGMVDVIESIEKITQDPYLRNSFGNKIRMDFGTGHELNFLCYLYSCLRKGEENGSTRNENSENCNFNFSNGNLNANENSHGCHSESCGINADLAGECQIRKSNENLKSEDTSFHPDIPITKISQVSAILREYFGIIRLYIKKFNIEAAGSRGCWSIDDYLLLPYLFGSAENFNDPRPIDCIGNGMFREAYNANCSPMLKDLCKLPWPSINVGMFKLYVEEVLGRHVVTQHFIYSKYLPAKD